MVIVFASKLLDLFLQLGAPEVKKTLLDLTCAGFHLRLVQYLRDTKKELKNILLILF